MTSHGHTSDPMNQCMSNMVSEGFYSVLLKYINENAKQQEQQQQTNKIKQNNNNNNK